MKKNSTLRVAALLLALTLITSCFVGSTFAKYATTASGKDTARVAHWGFGATSTNELADLFAAIDETGITASGEHVLAPGTSGTATFSFVTADSARAPEVAYQVTISTEGSTGISPELDEVLTFTLDGVEYEKWTDLLAAIEALDGSNDGAAQYRADQEIPEALKNGAKHTITWTWVWAEDSATNAKDTALGNDAFADLAKLGLTITVTVEQLNEIS